MNNSSQQTRILELFRNHKNAWVPLPEILQLGIAQYNARIFELRHEGYQIENKIKEMDGQRHSWFRLVEEQAEKQLAFV